MLTIESIILISLCIGLLLTLVIQTRSILQIKKHNLVLYRLRATHDEILLLLIDNIDNESLTKEDKLEIRTTIEKLEVMTRYFKKAKERLTFKNLSNHLFIKKNSPYSEIDNKPISPELGKVRKNVTGALLFAFDQYVPFFKFRLIMKLFSILGNIILALGLNELFDRYERFIELKNALEVYKKANRTYHQYEMCEA